MELGRAGGRWRLAMGVSAVVIIVAGGGFTARVFGPRPEVRSPLLRHSSSADGPAELLIDSAIPREPVGLLFFQGRPAVVGSDGRRVVVSESGTVLASGATFEVRPLALELGGRVPLGASPAEDGGWWISTIDGQLLQVQRNGSITLTAAAPFGATALWPNPRSLGVLATRSPERFGFLPESPEAPVVIELGARGLTEAGLGRIVVPQHSLLATLANSGYAVAAGDTVFFAPLSRSELIAFDPRGDTVWHSRADLVPPTPEPRIALVAGEVRIHYQPFNLAMTLGPDGRLYVLRATDTAVSRVRLDVLDRTSGQVLWRAELPSPRATLVANRRGRVYALDEERLLGALPADTRERVPAFDLARRGGGNSSLGDLGGKVALINVWASWCLPCRTEMPALDSLWKEVSAPEFAFVAISEDENRDDADRFLTELGLDFPVLYGNGRLRNRLHYPGLPYTLLLDREGRIVRRWIGQLGRSDLELIRLLVRQELAAPAPKIQQSGSHHHHEGR